MNEIALIESLQGHAIQILQTAYLSAAQIRASEASMGLDTQLIDDGTYFCVFDEAVLVGCGGWSYRATLYGGNHSAGRSARALDPKTERARIRAMYTHPDHVRRGIGRLILGTSEAAAKAHGFSDLEMAATEAGRPFYERCGYVVENKFFDEGGAVPVPLYTMIKSI
jgi:GNAT superfamily N-acetyltransferase